MKSLKAGSVITADVIRSVRPGFGLPPKYLELVLGKRLAKDVQANSPVMDDCLE